MLIVQEAVHVCGTGYIGELFALSAYFYSEPKTCLKNKSIKRKKKKDLPSLWQRIQQIQFYFIFVCDRNFVGFSILEYVYFNAENS